MYLDHMSPRYVIAMSVNCCTSFLAIIAATVLRFMLVRLNKKLDQGYVLKPSRYLILLVLFITEPSTRYEEKLNANLFSLTRIHVEGAINALPGGAAEHGFRFKV